MQILVVEDDDLVREYVETCLMDEGHQVVSANNVSSAMESIGRAPRPNLLVTDFNLGDDRDGVDVAEKFVELCPDGRFVLISGQPVAARKKLNNRQGGTFLSKPFFKRDLLSAIDRAMLT